MTSPQFDDSAVADNFMALFEAWKKDQDSVHVSWNAYFSGLELGIDRVSMPQVLQGLTQLQ